MHQPAPSGLRAKSLEFRDGDLPQGHVVSDNTPITHQKNGAVFAGTSGVWGVF
jgi:hypothetical protein